MPFIMTRAADTAQVEIEIDREKLILSVGPIPNEIGEKIQELSINTLDAVKAKEAGDDKKMTEIMVDNISSVNEMVRLLCKYGVRNLSGLEYADGSAVPCNVETEKETNYTILSEDTLQLYIANAQVLEASSGAIMAVRKIGIGKYIKGGFKTIKEAMGVKEKAPKKPTLRSSSAK